MREKELRLALVCYGGASLAIYMNGISHEILKLVRASRAFHNVNEPEELSFDEAAPKRPYSTDTEELYFELLKALSPKIDLRVIVDVVSGSSAGGINGIFLSRALAHDLDLAPLRTMWLELGDVEQLMEADTIAARWNKLYIRPFLWLFGKRVFGGTRPDTEMRRKLSRFMRSRWFKPPFSGKHMLNWMLNAGQSMGTAEAGHSLMPPGHKLDLFVSLTNFFGQGRRVILHDPSEILEHQHGVTLNFSYRAVPGSTVRSDFGDDNIAGLGFAARATSSFPGAFPPLRLLDLKKHLKARAENWPGEEAFLAKNFPELVADKKTLFGMSFIDGGVTNNKPFAAATKAVYERPAHREVDRRIIYVDPLPDDPKDFANNPENSFVPGFFRTILSALAEIPRSEPIYEDLMAIAEHNKAARRTEVVLQSIEVEINQLVDKTIVLDIGRHVDTALLASWRERSHEYAHQHTGFSYPSYLQSKTVQLLERISQLMVEGAALQGHSIPEGTAFEALKNWAEKRGILYSPSSKASKTNHYREHIQLLRELDADYRVRRLRFVTMKLNHFLQDDPQAVHPGIIKKLKKSIYEKLEKYRANWQADTYEPDIFTQLEARPLTDAHISAFLTDLGKAIQAEELDMETDEMLAELIPALNHEELQHTLFRAYVGYAFYDVMTLPMSRQADLLEIDEIRVDRISPLDCAQLHEEDVRHPLQSTRLYNFGGFFSRRARENDYIWGRIHATTRLVDFIIDAAGPDALPVDFDLTDFRRRLNLKVVETEAEHVTMSPDLIDRLKKKFSN